MQRELKVGDKVRIKGKEAVVISLTGWFVNQIYVKFKNGYTDSYDRECLELIEEKTWETLAKGDVVIHEYKHEYSILSIIDNCVLLSEGDDHSRAWSWFTVQELKKDDWKIKQPEPVEKVTEMTISEAEKLLEKSEGKKIKIVE